MGIALAAAVLTAGPAAACGGLVAPNGTVRLLRTSTLAAYTAGVEHYVTSFQFAGGGAEVGSIVPLPGIPTKVERGGDWTLQRLQRETQPVLERFAADGVAQAASAPEAQVILETRIDALDVTVLKGGGTAVGDWAREHGFALTPDAPEVLDFYAKRSPIFMAARFDATAARAAGQGIGDGTPIHLTIPTDAPWVPIKILALGRAEQERVEADVYLLTDERPTLLAGAGLRTERSEAASASLLDDLRSDKGMEWMPRDMHLTYLRVEGTRDQLDHDLAISPTGGVPSRFDFDRVVDETATAAQRQQRDDQRNAGTGQPAGTKGPLAGTGADQSGDGPVWPAVALGGLVLAGVLIAARRLSS
ncbi:MAG TPA: DUF2330 domain-containing protein [Acidimicrobiales bacterium]|nr:DUF2330 domain-containing protein [Acidimicrobiales bacterium]